MGDPQASNSEYSSHVLDPWSQWTAECQAAIPQYSLAVKNDDTKAQAQTEKKIIKAIDGLSKTVPNVKAAEGFKRVRKSFSKTKDTAKKLRILRSLTLKILVHASAGVAIKAAIGLSAAGLLASISVPLVGGGWTVENEDGLVTTFLDVDANGFPIGGVPSDGAHEGVGEFFTHVADTISALF